MRKIFGPFYADFFFKHMYSLTIRHLLDFCLNSKYPPIPIFIFSTEFYCFLETTIIQIINIWCKSLPPNLIYDISKTAPLQRHLCVIKELRNIGTEVTPLSRILSLQPCVFDSWLVSKTRCRRHKKIPGVDRPVLLALLVMCTIFARFSETYIISNVFDTFENKS